MYHRSRGVEASGAVNNEPNSKGDSVVSENDTQEYDGRSPILSDKWNRPMNVCLAGWALIYLMLTVVPSAVDYLAIFDPVTFKGIRDRAACMSGDAVANSRVLMIAWVISAALFTQTLVSWLRHPEFSLEFVDRAKIFMKNRFVGKYSARRFKYYAWIALPGLLVVTPGYLFIFSAFFGDHNCDKLDRALIAQGGYVIVSSFMIGLFLALSISFLLRSRRSVNQSTDTR
jgi:hypothetical protein